MRSHADERRRVASSYRALLGPDPLPIEQIAVAASCDTLAAQQALSLLSEREVPLVETSAGWSLAAPVELLEREPIETHLGAASTRRLQGGFDILDDVDSTNAHLFRVAPRDCQACFGELQSAGRARRGRRWISPYAQNIYLSLGVRWRSPLANTQGLSLAVGVVVAEVLRACGLAEVMLKWPNDVQSAGAKICGILIETAATTGQLPLVVVGIGLNVHAAPVASQRRIDQPWTSVEAALGRRISRNELVDGCSIGCCTASVNLKPKGWLPACLGGRHWMPSPARPS